MKHELTLANIKAFVLEKKPVGVDSEGRIIYQPNPRGAPYYVFDLAPGAPVGFALKVAKRKTFVVQRKVEGKTFRASLGSVAEFSLRISVLTRNCRRSWKPVSRHVMR